MGAAVVEVLLSMDNICLFHQIFEHFKVPVEVRPGLLFIGTPFMVLMRFMLFFSIKGIYDSIRPLMFAIGVFCCYQGGIVLWMTLTGQEEDDDEFDAESSGVVMWFKALLGDKLVTKYQGSAFYVTMDGAARYTPMFLVLLAIEVTDVAFCIDGVSTIFMVDHYHVWTLFVGDIVAGGGGLASAVIAVGHCLEMNVVAEGAETEDQLSFLRWRDCDEVQGFLISKPLVAAEFVDMVNKGPVL